MILPPYDSYSLLISVCKFVYIYIIFFLHGFLEVFAPYCLGEEEIIKKKLAHFYILLLELLFLSKLVLYVFFFQSSALSESSSSCIGHIKQPVTSGTFSRCHKHVTGK